MFCGYTLRTYRIVYNDLVFLCFQRFFSALFPVFSCITADTLLIHLRYNLYWDRR